MNNSSSNQQEMSNNESDDSVIYNAELYQNISYDFVNLIQIQPNGAIQ
jgi:hypothetical protein